MRNYGFINPLSMEQSDPRYVPALRIALVQFEMVEQALLQERKRLTALVSPQWLPWPMVHTCLLRGDLMMSKHGLQGGTVETAPELAAVQRYLSSYRQLLSEVRSTQRCCSTHGCPKTMLCCLDVHQAYEIKANDYLSSFEGFGNSRKSLRGKLNHALQELGIR